MTRLGLALLVLALAAGCEPEARRSHPALYAQVKAAGLLDGPVCTAPK